MSSLTTVSDQNKALLPVHQLAQVGCLAVVRGQHHRGVRHHDCSQLELVARLAVAAALAGARHNGDAQAAARVLADLQEDKHNVCMSTRRWKVGRRRQVGRPHATAALWLPSPPTPTIQLACRLCICMREVRWRHRPSTREGLQAQPAAHVIRARPMPW